jgi:hypothetical protein
MVYTSTNTFNLVSDQFYYQGTGTFPYLLKIDPSNLNYPNYIKKITYYWGDGSMDEVYANISPDVNFNNLLIQPNQTVVEKLYENLTVENLKTINVLISIEFFDSISVPEFIITLNLKNPKLNFDLFSSFKLLKTRMFGHDNKILYTFKTINPEFIAMSLVNWKKSSPTMIMDNQSISSKPYNIVPPSFYNFNNNKDIENIPYEQTTFFNPDSATTPNKI